VPPRMAVRSWGGGDNPFEPKSLDEEEEEEGEVTPPPLSPLCKSLPSFGDIIKRQGGITADIRQPKQTRIETEPTADLPQQPCLTLLYPNSRGSSVVSVLMEMTHLLKLLPVPLCSSSPGGSEPSPKAYFGAFLWVSSWYACGVAYCLCGSSLSYFLP
jgi:hypothetical protein